MPENNVEDNDKIRPWTSDTLWNDPLIRGKMGLVISVIQDFARITELLPDGRHMSKEESIPKLWDATKDLKQECIKELHSSFKMMYETFTTRLKKTDENNLKDMVVKREDNTDDEMEEIDSSDTKRQKTDSSIENITNHQTFNEEGTHVIPFSVQMYCTFSLRWKVLDSHHDVQIDYTCSLLLL